MDEHKKLLARARRRIALSAHRRRESSAERRMVPIEFVSTTPEVPGLCVVRPIGLVTVSVARANSSLRDIATAWRDDWGGRMGMVGRLADEARNEAIDELRIEAGSRGANGLIGVAVTIYGVTSSVLLASATGTAVVLDAPADSSAPDAEVLYCPQCGEARSPASSTCAKCGADE